MKEIINGFSQGNKADLMLCLGSNLDVMCTDVGMAQATMMRGKQMVIVNLEETPLSDRAFHIYARTDDVMKLLMKKLGN